MEGNQKHPTLTHLFTKKYQHTAPILCFVEMTVCAVQFDIKSWEVSRFGCSQMAWEVQCDQVWWRCMSGERRILCWGCLVHFTPWKVKPGWHHTPAPACCWSSCARTKLKKLTWAQLCVSGASITFQHFTLSAESKQTLNKRIGTIFGRNTGH